MGAEQSISQSPQKKIKRQYYVKQAIKIIKQAKSSVDRANRFANFELVNDLVNQSAQVFRAALIQIFKEQNAKYKQNWLKHGQSLVQMEEQLVAQLQNISQQMPIWQTRPLKTKIDLIKTSANNIMLAADRATPEIHLNENKLKQFLQKAIDVKFCTNSILSKDQNSKYNDNESSRFSVGKIKSRIKTLFASPTKKSPKIENAYHFQEGGDKNRSTIPQLLASHSITQLNSNQELKSHFIKEREKVQKRKDFKANRYFSQAQQHIKQQKGYSKPRCISLDSINLQQSNRRLLNQSFYKKTQKIRQLSELAEECYQSSQQEDNEQNGDHSELKTFEGKQSKIDTIQLSSGRDCSPSIVAHRLKK